MPNTDAAHALKALLERERLVILSGRLADLASFPAEKARLLNSLASLRDSDCIKDLARLAQRNQTLLEAARQGLREVRDRLSEIRRTAGTLEVYSPEGERQRVSIAPSRVERRA